MDQKTVPRVGIIGCGRIGSLWDEETSHEYSKTHAKAFHKLNARSLVAFCDTNLDRARTAAQFWSCDKFYNQVDAFLENSFDIISVCTPVTNRKEILQKIKSKSPNAVLVIEKPFAESSAEASEFLNLLSEQDNVILNYSRRFAPGIKELKNQIASGHFGKLQAGNGFYGNGLLNNGSHMLNLIEFLLGRIDQAHASAKVADGRKEDETFSFQATLGETKISIHGLNHNYFTVFELDLVFEKGRVRLAERGEKIEIQSIIPDPVYAGFKILGPAEIKQAGLSLSLDMLAREAWDLSLKRSSVKSCTPEDSYQTIKLIETIRRSHVSN